MYRFTRLDSNRAYGMSRRNDSTLDCNRRSPIHIFIETKYILTLHTLSTHLDRKKCWPDIHLSGVTCAFLQEFSSLTRSFLFLLYLLLPGVLLYLRHVKEGTCRSVRTLLLIPPRCVKSAFSADDLNRFFSQRFRSSAEVKTREKSSSYTPVLPFAD